MIKEIEVIENTYNYEYSYWHYVGVVFFPFCVGFALGSFLIAMYLINTLRSILDGVTI